MKTMMLDTYTAGRRKALEAALAQVLTPAQRSMVRELLQAENPKGSAPQAEDMLYWLRLNMPVAAGKIEAHLHPRD